MGKSVRHILGLSGGKDSAALAVLMHKRVPNGVTALRYAQGAPGNL